jgi:hypothetical protein
LFDEGANMIRKILAIAATAIFAFGLFWQVGRWVLRWSGYGLGLRRLPGGYDDLVESFAGTISGGSSLGWIVGPWLLMSMGLMTLTILYSRTSGTNERGD